MLLEAKVIDIQIQPLKGCGPLALKEARMTKAGVETPNGRIQDHFLVAVTGSKDERGDHNFLTQRVQVDSKKNLYVPGSPELALVKPEIIGENLVFKFNNDEVQVPQVSEDNPTRKIPVQVWEYRGQALEVPRLSEWLSDQLKRNVKVARTSDPWDRKARQNYKINDNPLRAQDGYPVHAVAMKDVQAIFDAIRAPVDPNRFRYQILLDDIPFREIHNFDAGIINGVAVFQPKPCGRCEVTGRDQVTGQISMVKPLSGLVKLGVGRWIGPDGQKHQIMGENWLPNGDTLIRRGDVFQFTDLRETPLQFEQQKI